MVEGVADLVHEAAAHAVEAGAAVHVDVTAATPGMTDQARLHVYLRSNFL